MPALVRNSSGFTIIELLVSVIILAVVAGAAGLLFATSGNMQTQAKVRLRQAALAELALERVHENDAWSKRSDCKRTYLAATRTCAINVRDGSLNDFYDVTSKIQYTETVIAHGIDSSSDGKGAADHDGAIPDVYQIKVVISQNRLPKVKPYVLTAVINPLVRYRVGTLKISTCAVTPQIDDRVSLAQCSNTNWKLDPPPELDLSDPDNCGNTRCKAWVCANPLYSRWDCRGASAPYSAGSAANTSYFNFGAFPVSVRYKLEGTDLNTAMQPVIRGTTDANGISDLKNLTPGKYSITFTPPAGYSSWSSHSIPAGSLATIEPGLENRTIQMFQPAATREFDVSIEEVDTSVPDVKTYHRGLSHFASVCARLQPAPLDRAPTFDADDKSCAYRGEQSLRFKSQYPGLYAADLLGAGDWNFHKEPGFVWIDPTGLTVPPSGVYATQAMLSRSYCIDSVRRTYMTPTNGVRDCAGHPWGWVRGPRTPRPPGPPPPPPPPKVPVGGGA